MPDIRQPKELKFFAKCSIARAVPCFYCRLSMGFLTVALVVLRGEMRVCECPAIQILSAKKSGKPLPLF
jgi:hypothetical protein